MADDDLTPNEVFRALVEEHSDGNTDPEITAAVLAALKVNRRAAWVLFPIVLNEIRRSDRTTVRHIERVAFAGKVVTTSTREQLVDSSFLIGPGKRVSWLDATVEDHEARIAYQHRLMGSIGDDIENHQLAIKAIVAAGVTCLRELPEDERPEVAA